MLHDCYHPVFFDAVDIKQSGLLCFSLVIVLDARSTVHQVGWEDGLQTVHQEERREASCLAWLCPQSPEDMRELPEPSRTVWMQRIEDAGFEPL